MSRHSLRLALLFDFLWGAIGLPGGALRHTWEHLGLHWGVLRIHWDRFGESWLGDTLWGTLGAIGEGMGGKVVPKGIKKVSKRNRFEARVEF